MVIANISSAVAATALVNGGKASAPGAAKSLADLFDFGFCALFGTLVRSQSEGGVESGQTETGSSESGVAGLDGGEESANSKKDGASSKKKDAAADIVSLQLTGWVMPRVAAAPQQTAMAAAPIKATAAAPVKATPEQETVVEAAAPAVAPVLAPAATPVSGADVAAALEPAGETDGAGAEPEPAVTSERARKKLNAIEQPRTAPVEVPSEIAIPALPAAPVLAPVPAAAAAGSEAAWQSSGRAGQNNGGAAVEFPARQDATAPARTEPSALAFAVRVSEDEPASLRGQTPEPEAAPLTAKAASARPAAIPTIAKATTARPVPEPTPGADVRSGDQGASKKGPEPEARKSVTAAAVSSEKTAEAVPAASHEVVAAPSAHKPESALPAPFVSVRAETVASRPAEAGKSEQTANTEQLDRVSAISDIPKPVSSNRFQIQVDGSGDKQVSLQVSERAGQVHVAVRSDDSRLNANLRSDLNDLVSNLKQQGFKSETWSPVDAAKPVAASARGDLNSSGGDSPSNGGDQRQQQQQQRQNQQQARPEWFDELESSFGSAANLQERR